MLVAIFAVLELFKTRFCYSGGKGTVKCLGFRWLWVTYSIKAMLMVASFTVIANECLEDLGLKWPRRSSDFLEANCSYVGSLALSKSGLVNIELEARFRELIAAVSRPTFSTREMQSGSLVLLRLPPQLGQNEKEICT